MRKYGVIVLLVSLGAIFSCKKEMAFEPSNPTPYDLQLPPGFPPMDMPANNPMTEEGVALGRKLFYDKRLSSDNTISCGSCHKSEEGFSDATTFSLGVGNQQGNIQSMPIVNLGWSEFLFWDGRATSLEDQALEPVRNPIEMHEEWNNVALKLSDDEECLRMFNAAFGVTEIDSTLATRAMAQFLRSMVSVNSRFAKSERNEALLTPDELAGQNIFNSEIGDCFHCHGSILLTSGDFHNNGLDANPDWGRYEVTGDTSDIGRFKAPSLHNIEYTAPYMHDGRFATLDDVINHYSSGVVYSSTIDPNMKKVEDGGLLLNPIQKAQLKAFLLTFSDPDFIANPDFQDPN